jgi:hypothetical protein
MIRAAQSLGSHDIRSPERRWLLGLLVSASLASPALLLSGCAGATPPQKYQRPKSYIRGHGGNNGKSGGRGGN